MLLIRQVEQDPLAENLLERPELILLVAGIQMTSYKAKWAIQADVLIF